ncbi:S8 family serine peptidase [Nocardioides cavernae]|uniref:S8 family serine peptidase n=1 Tax=Nocardioides cavernae TaxID=1921566 RepID=A0ABR8N7U4_9ACTN|nr:S8 family serine peptidase [Nocardioides cavernae]MBD3923280.1 S8 family serine peptidase [Nocardioides cavernae]MBM7511798.1 subtilisin family serine protease [Nocardioides cavernae]
MSPSLPGAAAGLATLAVTAAVLTMPSAAAGPAAEAPATAAPAIAKTTTVTLLTGDVVTLTSTAAGRDTVSIDRAPGSTGGVQTHTIGGDLHVVPDAALPFLANGRVDADLFNVTELVEQGYDDASVSSIPLIVQYGPGVRAASAAAPEHSEKSVVLTSIHGAAIAASKEDATDFWADLANESRARFSGGIAKIHLDEKVEASLADTVAQVGAPDAWAEGLDGTGVTVAVLDTGVDQTHPDLAEQVTQTRSFVPGETVTDVDGHGTHVASTVAGTGAASDGREKGVAPGADLAIGKVLDNGGSGAASWIIEGMEWGASVADVVSMSLGSQEASDGTDPMALAVDALSESTDALFVIAAGNYGRVSGIGSPGAAQSALTVGAVDGADERAYFQDMGPRLGDAVVKPEIVAPGVDVLAARSSASPGEGSYVSLSGTSMATPHVAGAAAILAQQHPDWTGEQIRDALVSTAKPLNGQTAYQVGGGRLDVPSAAFGDVVATASVELGYHAWPSDDDAPVDRTITYTNLTDADVTVDLSEAVTDDALAPAPDGLVTLSAEQVTVPAGGTADVTVTGTPTAGAPGTTYSGTVVASLAGEQVAQTAVGLVKEEERYDLDINALDRGGKPAAGYVTMYRYGDQFVSTLELDPATGTIPTQRLRPGIYNVTSWLPVDADASGVALVGDPHVVVGEADRSITLDARKANEISVRTPRPSIDGARRPGYVHDSGIDSPFSAFVNQYDVSPAVDHVYAAPTGEVAGARYEFLMRWRRTAPLLSMSTGGTELDARNMPSARRWDGVARLDAVAAGTGTPDDFTGRDVRGKAVLVRRSDAVPAYEIAETAARAGARLVVVVNDRSGRYVAYAGGTDLPVVTLTQAEGQPLLDKLARGRTVTLTLDGTEQADYVYDLVRSFDGEIPAGLAWAPAKRDLATVTSRFIGEEGRLAIESRADCRDWNWPPCMEYFEPVHLGTERTDYVSTQAGSTWYEGVRDVRGWEQRGEERPYRRGEERTLGWFEPVARPRTGPGYWQPRRSGNFFAVNVPFASTGDDGVTGSMEDGSTVVTRLYAGDDLIDESPFQAVQREVPATDGWSDYRFEMDTTRPDGWRLATRTSTVWDFRAQTSESGDWVNLPLLQLDYDLDTDLGGRLTGRTQEVGLRAFQPPSVEGAGRVADATLEVSYDDGATWKRAELVREKVGAWSATVRIPARVAHLSLRATASDDAGNRVTQEVVRAAGVR